MPEKDRPSDAGLELLTIILFAWTVVFIIWDTYPMLRRVLGLEDRMDH